MVQEELIKSNILDVLLRAKARIDKPSKWISYWSQSDDGKKLGADGAIWEVAGFNTELSKKVIHILAEASGINPLWDDNSRITYLCRHHEVMAMFDKAIESLKVKHETIRP